tara:strand:+ start:269 stop:676 length:408 start_codon:yes stop_codon:yes gene_type:complete
MISPKVLKDLQEIIEENIDLTLFPYKKGNSIRIGDIVVRESKNNGHLVYCAKANKQIARTFSKTAAVAIARGGDVNDILQLDHDIMKHFNDCIFYRHTMRNSKNDTAKFVAESRYEISADYTHELKKKLDRYIFN